jgi:glycosyltransferase involved in cell wall biosynthesis
MTGIRYVSHAGTFGYADAAKRYILGLARTGVPVTWTPVVPTNATGTKFDLFKGSDIGDPDLDPFCNRQISYDTVIVHVLPRAVKDCLKQISAKTIVGYVTWDTNRLPDGWIELYGAFDRLFVPCTWNQRLFQEAGMRIPVHVIPHLFAGKNLIKKASYKKQAEFVFYTIGSWTLRKGTAEVLAAFQKAFTTKDNVKLIIKTDEGKASRRFSPRSFLRFIFNLAVKENLLPLKKVRTSSKIEIITDEIPNENIIQIHQKGDCYVSLTKGEAWGLGAFDAAGYGNPVIITGTGGPLDYLDADSAYFINFYDKKIKDRSVKEWSGPGHYWAMPDLEQAARMMRYIYTHREEAFEKGQILRDKIQTDFSEQVVIERILEAL